MEGAGSLPRPVTLLVGRAGEVGEISALLTGGGCVVLTGPAGVGKSRLAVEVARRRSAGSEHVWFIDLMPLRDARALIDAVAATLRVRETPGTTRAEAVATALSEATDPLLVLDGCEHLIDGIGEVVTELLSGVSELAVLATSQAPLGVPGEIVHRVEPLQTPGPEADTATVAAADAVRLFIDRASRIVPNLSFDEATLCSIAECCRSLDGLPLAIELAAARVQMFTPAEIARRLDDRFHLLEQHYAGSLRERTLRSAITWSHDLLSEEEQILFRRIAAFTGAPTLTALEDVCSDDLLPRERILPALTGLVERSLVTVRPAEPDSRYTMLDSIRAFARERLAECGEADDLHRRHLRWYAALGAEAASALLGGGQVEWLDRLDAEYDDIRSALGWGMDHGDDHALGLVQSLARFWMFRTRLEHGTEWLARALERVAEGTTLHGNLLISAGAFAAARGDLRRARECFVHALSVLRSLGELALVAGALNNLGAIAARELQFDEARDRFDEAFRVYQELDQNQGMAWALVNLTNISHEQGDADAARRYGEQALGRLRELGDLQALGQLLSTLGLVVADDSPELAVSYLTESVELRRQLGDRYGHAAALNNLGGAQQRRGDLEGAEASRREALRLAGRTADPHLITACAEALAETLVLRERWSPAAELFAAATTIRRQKEVPARPSDAQSLQRCERALERELGAAHLARIADDIHTSEEALAVIERHAGADAEEAPAAAENTETVFRKRGDVWEIRFKEAAFTLKDAKGLGYLHTLLARPGVEVHVSDLASPVSASAPAATDGLRTTAEEDAGPLLDADAKRAFRARLEELRETIADAEAFGDDECAARATEEMDLIVAELGKAVGLGGRDRKAASRTERMRVNVTRTIKTAIRRIEAHDPGLAHHLRSTIRTGVFCSYEPDPTSPPAWKT